MAPTREVNDVNKIFSVVTVRVVPKICAYAKFHGKIWNGSQEIEEHTPEWAPGEHDMKKILV